VRPAVIDDAVVRLQKNTPCILPNMKRVLIGQMLIGKWIAVWIAVSINFAIDFARGK
jgi:hypothetical protein